MTCNPGLFSNQVVIVAVAAPVLQRPQLFSEFDLETFKIYWTHLRDEISSNPMSFRRETATFARTGCKQSHLILNFQFWLKMYIFGAFLVKTENPELRATV